jgi:hypothetical protein
MGAINRRNWGKCTAQLGNNVWNYAALLSITQHFTNYGVDGKNGDPPPSQWTISFQLLNCWAMIREKIAFTKTW